MRHDSTDVVGQRLPKGSECQCMAAGCGLFFTGESAFNRHWTKTGHVHPSDTYRHEGCQP